MASDLFAVEGNTAENVETYDNYPNSPGADSVVEISPDRGLFLRFLNRLQKAGGAVGIPVYIKLRDQNGDHIPANTSAYFALQVQGMEEPTKVSEKRGNLSFYLSNDITTQRDTDNIDGSLFVLTAPETDGSEPVPKIDVRDIDRLFFKIDSAAEVDWSQSEFYIDTAAVSEGSL